MLGQWGRFPFHSVGRERRGKKTRQQTRTTKTKPKLNPSPVPLFQPCKWNSAFLALTIATKQKQVQASRSSEGSPNLPGPAAAAGTAGPPRPPAAALCSAAPELAPREGACCSVYWQNLLFPVSRPREQPQFPVCSDFPKLGYPISIFVIMGVFSFTMPRKFQVFLKIIIHVK